MSKANIEVESFVEGVVQQLLVEPGTTVPVGQVLAVLGNGVSTAPSPEAVVAPPGAAEAPPAAPAVAEVDATKVAVTDAASDRSPSESHRWPGAWPRSSASTSEP